MTADTTTLWVWLSPWLILLIRELWILWDRKRHPEARPRTISQVAKDYGPRVTFAVYLWSSQPTHWWWNADGWGSTWLGVLFWAIALGLLGWDVVCRKEAPAEWPTWKRRARHPLTWLVLGALAGRYLFPQAGGLPW